MTSTLFTVYMSTTVASTKDKLTEMLDGLHTGVRHAEYSEERVLTASRAMGDIVPSRRHICLNQ